MRLFFVGIMVLMVAVSVFVSRAEASSCPVGSVLMGDVCVEWFPDNVKEIDGQFVCTHNCNESVFFEEAVRIAVADLQSTGVPAEVVHLEIWRHDVNSSNGTVVYPYGSRHYENGPSGWKECQQPTNYVENVEICDGL